MEYIYSRLSTDSVASLLSLHFNLAEPLSCHYYTLGLHDNYLIESNNEKYIFRIYCNDWRSEEEILFELDLLTYLNNGATNVAAPITTRHSDHYLPIESPEGKRIAALFNYADGHAPGVEITAEECALLGSSVAKIHDQTSTFTTRHTRPRLDTSYLVDRSLTLIEPYLSNEQSAYLQQIQSRIQNKTSPLDSINADFGVCIGDVNPSNFHINEKMRITHFDFDQCGYAYRAFEIGKFCSSLISHKSKTNCIEAFIQGYENTRQLTNIEKSTIPYFEIASLIWVMSIHVSNANKIGYKYLEKSFWNRRMELIRQLDVEL